MTKFSISNFLASNQLTKVQIDAIDMSVQGVALTGCLLNFLVDADLTAQEIGFDFYTAFRDLEGTPHINFTHTMSIEALSSKNSATVRSEFRTFLHNTQISLVTALFNEDQLTDAEVDYILSVYPHIDFYNPDLVTFCAQPFIALESQDSMSNTTIGIINELMYILTDKIIAETMFELVKANFNSEAQKADFIESASSLTRL